MSKSLVRITPNPRIAPIIMEEETDSTTLPRNWKTSKHGHLNNPRRVSHHDKPLYIARDAEPYYGKRITRSMSVRNDGRDDFGGYVQPRSASLVNGDYSYRDKGLPGGVRISVHGNDEVNGDAYNYRSLPRGSSVRKYGNGYSVETENGNLVENDTYVLRTKKSNVPNGVNGHGAGVYFANKERQGRPKRSSVVRVQSIKSDRGGDMYVPIKTKGENNDRKVSLIRASSMKQKPSDIPDSPIRIIVTDTDKVKQQSTEKPKSQTPGKGQVKAMTRLYNDIIDHQDDDTTLHGNSHHGNAKHENSNRVARKGSILRVISNDPAHKDNQLRKRDSANESHKSAASSKSNINGVRRSASLVRSPSVYDDEHEYRTKSLNRHTSFKRDDGRNSNGRIMRASSMSNGLNRNFDESAHAENEFHNVKPHNFRTKGVRSGESHAIYNGNAPTKRVTSPPPVHRKPTIIDRAQRLSNQGLITLPRKSKTKQIDEIPVLTTTPEGVELELKLNLKGYKAQDIHINTRDNLLIIESKRLIMKEGRSESRVWTHQDYKRQFSLPDIVLVENLRCVLDGDGVLIINGYLGDRPMRHKNAKKVKFVLNN